MKMWHNNDAMLNELHQIKIRLWERSGNDFHKMAHMIEDEAKDEDKIPADYIDNFAYCRIYPM